jgi:D-xylose transport system substrate-binding protein
MKLRILLVVASCLLSVLLGLVIAHGGAAGVVTKSRKAPLIGLSLDTLKEERWQGDRDHFVGRAREMGVEVSVQSANGDDTRQIRDIESLITQNVDVLVIVPHNGAAMAKAVRLAREAGIPVIAYDRLITDCELDLYLTFDNLKVGELQAQYLVDHLSDRNPIRLVRIYGSKTDNNALLYKSGQDRVLTPLIQSGRVVVVHEDWAQDWRPENAKKIANAAITKAGRNFDGILVSNDGTAGGAIQALSEEGLAGKILVTGQDADLSACQRIVNGTQAMTVYKPVRELATRAAEIAVKMARGRPVIAMSATPNGIMDVPTVLLNVVAADRENMKSTVVADGFHSAKDIFPEAAVK